MRGTRKLSDIGVAIALIAVLGQACGSAAGPTRSPDGATISPVATGASPAPASPVATSVADLIVYGDVAVDGTRTVRVRCEGHGTPTILLEAGGTASNLNDYLLPFVHRLAATTTACAYSRAGGNGSPPMAEPVTMPAYVHDADALLTALQSAYGIDGPYVFVGWSFGGEVALAEASSSTHPVAGLVILDTDFPFDFATTCKASGRSAAACQALFDEDREAKTIEQSLQPLIHPLPGLPIALVSALEPGPDCAPTPGASTVAADIAGTLITAADCDALFVAIADAGLRNWRTLGLQVTQTRVRASHDHLIEQAGDAVAAVILGVVSEARQGPTSSP